MKSVNIKVTSRLENIDNIEKAALIEYNSGQIETLKATFEPYKDKVIIVSKLVADFNDIVALDSVIEERKNFYKNGC